MAGWKKCLFPSVELLKKNGAFTEMHFEVHISLLPVNKDEGSTWVFSNRYVMGGESKTNKRKNQKLVMLIGVKRNLFIEYIF